MKRRIAYISAKFSYWQLKRNILGKVMVLGNRCINIFSEKCILGQIPIAYQELCSEQLKCFPVNSSSKSSGELKSKSPVSTYFRHNIIVLCLICQYLTQRPKTGFKITMFIIDFWENAHKNASLSNTNVMIVSVRKKCLGLNLLQLPG